MIELSRDDIQRAIDREPAAVSRLVGALMPLVQVRVARALTKRRRPGRDPRQEVEDFCQEVFLGLFSDDARPLRAWDPARGMSFPNFVGMFAEHQVATIFRSGKRRPWNEDLFAEPDLEVIEGASDSPEPLVASRELFAHVLERLRAELSPKGYALFIALIVEERGVEEVCKETGMSADALYAWRSRLTRLVRSLVRDVEKDPGASESEPNGRTPRGLA